MPEKPIPFGNKQSSGYEPLAGGTPYSINIITEPGSGAVRRRPGVQAYSGAPSTTIDSAGIYGLHKTVEGKLYAVASQAPSRNIYRVTANGTVTLGTQGGTARPIFAETDALVVIAAGSDMRKIEKSNDVVSLLGGTPPKTTHVAATQLRLQANDSVVDKSKIRYSGVSGSPTDFSGNEDWSFGGIGLAGFFTAEARPDPVQAVHENTNELFVFGTTNLQVFSPNGQDVWTAGATREYGLIAPYSVIKVDQAFAFFDHRRRFVVTDGRTFEVISDGMETDIDSIADPSDCFGYRVNEGPADCLVWTFPKDGRTFVYQREVGWGQWQSRAGAQWGQLGITSHTHDSISDDNIVGMSDGRIGVLAMGVTDDLGETITAQVETGFLNRGTQKRKHCVAVRLTFERGVSTATQEPVGFLQYADSPGKWSQPKQILLGTDGDTNPVVRFRSLGIYRTRAWRFTFSAPVNLVLARVDEEFEVLDQ